MPGRMAISIRYYSLILLAAFLLLFTDCSADAAAGEFAFNSAGESPTELKASIPIWQR